ncbi:hypothetical protein B0H19DRAFT_1259317 [Mycena capillaripes]|nr:hypothetical protein B0H19DRAFT_1259317 [Mycena capillaripes]
MDSDSDGHADNEFSSESSPDDPAFSEAQCYGSGMFSRARHLTVTGQTFTNITNYTAAPAVPSDFRMISMGNIDLQSEHKIHSDDETGVANFRSTRASFRRVYSAKIDGRTSDMTVAMYQGDGAEEEWRQDTARYKSVRHPNIVQIYGAATSHNMHATVFHGDLVPFRYFLELYRHSPILIVYTYAYCYTEFEKVDKYFVSTSQYNLYLDSCTFFIRHSTGRLCVDPVPDDDFHMFDYRVFPASQTIKPLAALPKEAMAINFLTLDQYHDICFLHVSQHRHFYASASTTLNLGAVIFCSSGDQLNDSVEIVFLLEAEVSHGRSAGGEMMENGWTRLHPTEVVAARFMIYLYRPRADASWLSQANHVFNRLQITSHFEDYVVLRQITFQLFIPATTAKAPKGFLFVCPQTHFQRGATSVRWPECPAYWSHDPSGIERLSTEEATRLGFPSMQFEMDVYGYSYDASVYAGLRQFHEAKGFDPDSQDVARHLGELLYGLPGEVAAPVAHVHDKVSSADDEQSRIATKDDALENFGEKLVNDLLGSDTSPEHPGLVDEISVSRTFKFLMNFQLALILLLALSELYYHVIGPRYLLSL